jgi:N-ethylmaleimide reductase
MPDLSSPLPLGPITLPNRVLMAPLTRCRAQADGTPGELAALYYAQRASAGLIISEATCISDRAHGYPTTPGIYTPSHIEGWKRVTSAVHAAGGRIFCQLWHVGRLSHPDFQPNGEAPVSASAINSGGECSTPTGKKPRVTPRALETGEIAGVIEQYRHAAACAKEAGFDGVELHGANGYLPDQFLRDKSNTRTDRYGGPVENRARFMLEAAEALVSVWGAERVGVRLSPSGRYHGIDDSDPLKTFGYAVRELAKLGLVYQHIMEPMAPGDYDHLPVRVFRPMFDGVLITNSNFTYDKAQAYLKEGWADAVAFGKAFISNPDLPERFRRGGSNATLNAWDDTTFYGQGAKGYTDYPSLAG